MKQGSGSGGSEEDTQTGDTRGIGTGPGDTFLLYDLLQFIIYVFLMEQPCLVQTGLSLLRYSSLVLTSLKTK